MAPPFYRWLALQRAGAVDDPVGFATTPTEQAQWHFTTAPRWTAKYWRRTAMHWRRQLSPLAAVVCGCGDIDGGGRRRSNSVGARTYRRRRQRRRLTRARL